MSPPRPPVFLLAVLLAAGTTYAADDPVLLFLLETKKAYREKRWDDADAALRHLLELAAAPEREPEIPRILPAYHFYAAAVAWERKDQTRARAELARYFEYHPDATIDPSMYPKSYTIFFDAQRTEAQRVHPRPAEEAGLPDFATLSIDPATMPLYTGDPSWPESAVRHLLTEPERREFATLPDDAARRDWVFRFWKKLDPDPSTMENEYQVEFYRRSQYADAHFSTETVRGSLSDRGHVLLVMGPPTYIGRSNLLRSNDPMTTLQSTQTAVIRDARGRTSITRVATKGHGVTPGDIEGEVQNWYYRKDRIPKGVPFQDLQFTFFTKEGYGVGVFQKDAREFLALQRATRLLRSGS